MARTITLMEAVHVLQLGHLPEPCQSLPFLDRLKQLDDERVTIIEAAKAAAFAQADEAVSLLNAIGYTCEIALAPEPAATPRKTPRQVYTNGPCPICEFRTDPPHDARRHRSQGEEKQPFGDDELSGLGLTRVD